MSQPSSRAALDAVHAARPIVARLSTSRDKEDCAADIIDAWNAVETGLRSLVGGTALGGQQLIRELRQRQFLSLEQANSLAEFHAARERASRTDYTPTEGDVSAVRDAFLKLESGLMSESAAPSAPIAAAIAPQRGTAPPIATDDNAVLLNRPPRKRPAWVIPASVAAIVAVAVGVWFMFGRGGSNASFNDGVAAYTQGRREAAQGSFQKAAAEDPTDPMAHVYLARIERDQGNLINANTEAVKAVQLGPNNALALRELASTLFAQQNFDGARKFYIRAVQSDTSDRVSQGFLGCSLVRLGRFAEGQKWIQRAGAGAWSACAPAGNPAPSATPVVPMTVPR